MEGWTRISAGIALTLLGRGLALAGAAIFAAALPLEAFGRVSHARGLVAALAPLASLGLAVACMRRIPQAEAVGRRDLAAAHVWLGICVAAAMTAPFALAAWLWPDLDPAARWLLAATPAAGALFFGAQAGRALDRPTLAALPPGLAAAGAGLAFLAWPAGGADPALTAAILVALVLLGAAVLQAALMLRPLSRDLAPRRLLAAPLRPWLVEAAPLCLSLAARATAILGPFLMLPLWADAAETGVYALAWLAAQAPLTALAGAAGACAPRLSAALGRGDPRAARRAAWQAAGAGAACALVLGAVPAAALALAPGWADDLRPGLAAAASPLAILSAAALIQGLEAPLGAIRVALGQGLSETAIQGLGAVAALGAAATLAPVWGAEGAAAAVLAGAAARLGLGLARPALVRRAAA